MSKYEAKYAEWQKYWQQLIALKRKHQPEYAPIEEWAPLEAKCKIAFQEMLKALNE